MSRPKPKNNRTLLKHGATIICVDLDRDFIWKKIFKAVRDSPGRIVFPVKEGVSAAEAASMSEDELAKVSGSNLLADTPEIANWPVTHTQLLFVAVCCI